MIKIRRNCKEIEVKLFGARKSVKTGEKQGSAKFRSLKEASAKSALCCETISQPQQVRCEIATLLRNHFAAQLPPLRKFLQLRNNLRNFHKLIRNFEGKARPTALKSLLQLIVPKTMLIQNKLKLKH